VRNDVLDLIRNIAIKKTISLRVLFLYLQEKLFANCRDKKGEWSYTRQANSFKTKFKGFTAEAKRTQKRSKTLNLFCFELFFAVTDYFLRFVE